MYKGVGFALEFAYSITFFLEGSLRPNYFIFIGYLKTGAGRGSSEPPKPPLDPPLHDCAFAPKASRLIYVTSTKNWMNFLAVLQ